MSGARERPRLSGARRQAPWIATAVLMVTAIVIAGIYITQLFEQDPLDKSLWKEMDAADKAVATGQWRLMLVHAGTAIGAVIALAFTAATYRLSRRGQFTERFTKALERLAEQDLYLKVGAIHALEHVSADSRAHRENVTEVLLSFVAKHSRERRRPVPLKSALSEGRSAMKLPTDVQAALTVLSTRPRPRSPLNLRNLDLRGADLEGANLKGSNLSGTLLHRAYLSRSQLQHADLVGTRLRYAKLRKANLSWANLTEVNLERASLVGAKLRRTVLHEARLDHADLSNARLRCADLTGARLKGADLHGANLIYADISGADLREAKGLTETQLRWSRFDEHTVLPENLVVEGWWVKRVRSRATDLDQTTSGGSR